ncbi:hypothetical protein ACG74X_03685 [Marivita sp. S0852]|uniref:hypothetical protein n=1 Tax=Marivita sp. S0852 TaxID=3373893 RepID=UPI00398292B7
MKHTPLILALLVLAACGAEGDPIRPSVNTTVSVGSEGIRTSTGVIVQTGSVSVGVGF